MVRRERPRSVPEGAPEPAAVLGQEDRLDMIERLVMVGQPWCVDELRAIREKDRDPVVRDAADAALLVIGSRGA